MIVHGCLERDFCKANSIDTATHFMIMRRDFERYRDRFQSYTGMDLSSLPPIDDHGSTSQTPIVRCVAFLACFVLSCIALCSWFAWVQ
jgi:hypothetical protein